MAGEIYTRTYVFKRQTNTAAERSVALSKFAVEGDTTHSIGQIVGLTYTHSHTSLGTPTRTLRGRLVLADGNVIVSAEDAHHFSSDVQRYTNNFDALPTPEQFGQIVRVETINESSAADQTGYGGTKLYWRASSDDPIRLTLRFMQEPPTHYAPVTKEFKVGRCDANGVEDPTGKYILTTLKLGVGDASGLADSPSVRIYYAAGKQKPSSISGLSFKDATEHLNTLLTAEGMYKSTLLLPGEWAAGDNWHFCAVFSCGDEKSPEAWESVGNSFAPISMSRSDGGKHIAIGGFPQDHGVDTSLDIFPPVWLHGGIYGAGYSAEETDSGAKWLDGRTIWRKCAYYSGALAASSTTTVMQIPGATWVLDLRGSVLYAEGWLPLNYAPSNLNYRVEARVKTNGDVVLTIGSGRGYTGAVVVVEYVK